jgi:hypothetical protein
MFKSNQPKNAFLQKKNQEKAKVAEQQKYKAGINLVQKEVRAFLARRTLIGNSRGLEHVKLRIIMK